MEDIIKYILKYIGKQETCIMHNTQNDIELI